MRYTNWRVLYFTGYAHVRRQWLVIPSGRRRCSKTPTRSMLSRCRSRSPSPAVVTIAHTTCRAASPSTWTTTRVRTRPAGSISTSPTSTASTRPTASGSTASTERLHCVCGRPQVNWLSADSPSPAPTTSFAFYSQLCSSITPSLFHSRLKTYLFHQILPPVVSFLPRPAFTDYHPDHFFWATRFLFLK